MPTERLQFNTNVTDHIPTAASGPAAGAHGFLINGVAENDQEYGLIVRPAPNLDGVATFLSVADQTHEGRGCFHWNDTFYMCGSNRIGRATTTSSVTMLTGNLDATAGFVSWDSSLEQSGILLMQDRTKIWSIHSDDDLYPLNPDAWTATTAYVVGDFVENDTGKVYICTTAGTSAGSGGPTGTGTGITDGTCVWDYKVTITGMANIPTSMVPGLVVLDQYVFVADEEGNLYNSNVGDSETWTAGDQKNSELLADDLKAITRHINYIVAFGERGTEFFYNAENASGSPLGRLEGSFSYVGCDNGDTVVNIENDVFWVSKNQMGGKAIHHLNGFTPEKVSTETVDHLLNISDTSSGEISAFACKLFGENYYVLIKWNTTTKTISWALGYGLKSQLWSVFTTTMLGRGITNVAEPTISGTNYTNFFWSCFRYHAGTIIRFGVASGASSEDFEAWTEKWDAQNQGIKFIHRIDVLADRNTSNNYTITLGLYNDDGSLKASRTLEASDGLVKSFRWGSTERCRFRISSSETNIDAPRFIGLDVHYTQGVSGIENNG